MYSLSYKAVQEYRNGAEDHKQLSTDVLKLRLNALARSAMKRKYIVGGMEHIFGSLHIKVIECNNRKIINGVKWDSKRIPASGKEVSKMKRYFKEYGLNSNGFGRTIL